METVHEDVDKFIQAFFPTSRIDTATVANYISHLTIIAEYKRDVTIDILPLVELVSTAPAFGAHFEGQPPRDFTDY